MASHPLASTLTDGGEKDDFAPTKKPESDCADAIDDPAFVRATNWKIDWRILPLLGLIYSFSIIDRSNTGIARVVGMDTDLKTNTGNRYSIISCIYFIPYILCQLPSNLLLRKFGVIYWISFCTFAWGAVQLGMGFVRSWGYLALCRVLLGVFEAGYFPAMVYLITTWYTRHEVQKRLAAFYLTSVLASGFSSILAYGISKLAGRGGRSGWAWVFIIEGIITMAIGILALFFLPDFPHKNTFLNKEETELVLGRVERDRGDSMPDPLSLEKVLNHLCDWKIWVFGLMFIFFITLILRGMGWSVTNSLLLTAPPCVFASMSVFFFAWLSDKHRRRVVFILAQTLMTVFGLCLTGFVNQPWWKYTGLFFTSAGASGCIPGILAYSSNNIVSHSKRAVTTAIVISLGGVGGIIATTVFRQEDAPRYLPGIYTTLGCQGLLIILVSGTACYFRTQNKRAKAGKLESPLEGQPGFLYVL